MSDSHTFPKREHLKSRKKIQSLFSLNQSVKAYPLIAVYDIDSDDYNIRAGFSVSKKKFAKAVDRNFIKRRMREAFRTQNNALKEKLTSSNKSMSFMILYGSSEIIAFDELKVKMHGIITQLENAIDK